MGKHERDDAPTQSVKLRRVLEQLQEFGANRDEAGRGVFAVVAGGRRPRPTNGVPVGPRFQACVPAMTQDSRERGDVLVFSPAWGFDSHACGVL